MRVRIPKLPRIPLIQRKRHHAAPGTAPGTYRRDTGEAVWRMQLIAYAPDQVVEFGNKGWERLDELLHSYSTVWIHIEGTPDGDLLDRLGKRFGLHRLSLEDVVNTHQQPKIEYFPDHIFAITRLPLLDEALTTEQLSIFAGVGFVLSFLEGGGDSLEPVRERIRRGSGRMRGAGPGYLSYALIDAAVDHYYPLLNQIEDHLDALETGVLYRPEQSQLEAIQSYKRSIELLRRIMRPQRTSLQLMLREPTPVIDDETRVYLRDCMDHAVYLLELLESHRSRCTDLVNLYMSALSNKMNQVMRTLTVIATIFIPLTFISGIYGMNFNTEISPYNLPELNWVYGYPFALGLMAVSGIGLYIYMRWKDWS